MAKALLALVVATTALGACSPHRDAPSPTAASPAAASPPAASPTTASPTTASPTAASPRADAAKPTADAATPAADASPAASAGIIPATARQLITGVIDDWSATHVTLRRWRRTSDGGSWFPDGDAWQGMIGKSGAAWGIGLHGSGAPDGRPGPTKREGDAASPAGAFALRGTYGYAAVPPRGTRVPYTQATAGWQCVDDARSSHYTQIVDGRSVTVDWGSAEAMRRSDALYTWVIDIAHNRAASPGAGSCIFFHVWRNPTAATVGCTAMPEKRLAQLIAGVDPTAVYVLLPRAEYDAFATAWALPAREK